VAEKPIVGNAEEYDISAVFRACIEATAEASLACIRALIRFGIAIAAMIRMIATTISNSIREKPFCDRFIRKWLRPVQPDASGHILILALAWNRSTQKAIRAVRNNMVLTDSARFS
jgi:hypothetical protein